MSFRVVFLAVLLVVVVGGGAMAYLGWERFQSAQESTTANAEVCGALKARERRALLGVPSPTRQDRLEGVNAEFTCRWSPKNADPTKHLIEVVSTPARHWADGLATSVDSATGMFQPGALDPARMESLKVLARNADQLGDREACALAGTTFEMSGAPSKAQEMVRSIPPAMSTLPGVIAQSCRKGTYTAVFVSSPDLPLGPKLERRVADALRKVEKRLSA